jgi:hypothetical protein
MMINVLVDLKKNNFAFRLDVVEVLLQQQQ